MTAQEMHKRFLKGLEGLKDPDFPYHAHNIDPEEWAKAAGDAQEEFINKMYIKFLKDAKKDRTP